MFDRHTLLYAFLLWDLWQMPHSKELSVCLSSIIYTRGEMILLQEDYFEDFQNNA